MIIYIIYIYRLTNCKKGFEILPFCSWPVLILLVLMVKTLHNVRVVHIYVLGWSDITSINGENVAQCTSSTYLCTRVE